MTTGPSDKGQDSDRLFRFGGSEAYEAAGGGYTCDLFAAEGEAYANDADLIASLAQRCLDGLAAEARAEGWTDVIADQREPIKPMLGADSIRVTTAR